MSSFTIVDIFHITQSAPLQAYAIDACVLELLFSWDVDIMIDVLALN